MVARRLAARVGERHGVEPRPPGDPVSIGSVCGGSRAGRRTTASHAWSPDGRTVAFASNQQGAFDLWTVAAGGAGRALLVDAPGEARAPDWHPSGDAPRLHGSRRRGGGRVGRPTRRHDRAARRVVRLRRAPGLVTGRRRVGFLRGRGGTLYPWSAHGDGTRRGRRRAAPRRARAGLGPARRGACAVADASPARPRPARAARPRRPRGRRAAGSSSGSRPRRTTSASGRSGSVPAGRRGATRCSSSSSCSTRAAG